MILFLKIIYLFIHERHTEREAQTQAEGEGEEAGSMQGAWYGTRSRVSRITPWAEGRRWTAESPRDPLLGAFWSMPVGSSGLGASATFSLHCMGGNKETLRSDCHVFPWSRGLFSESSYILLGGWHPGLFSCRGNNGVTPSRQNWRASIAPLSASLEILIRNVVDL